MTGLLTHLFCFVIGIGVVQCYSLHDYTTSLASHIDAQREVKNIEFKLNPTNKSHRGFEIFQLKDKLLYLKHLKNLLHQHLEMVLLNKLGIFQKVFTTEPPTTINIITTEDGDTSTTMPTTIYPNNTEPVPCYEQNDLAVVVDASGSVGSENYKTALEFAAKLLSTWKTYDKNGVAAAVYASSVYPIFDFKEGAQLNADIVIKEILTAPYISTGTASHLALDWALSEHISNSTVEKNLVFLTDGFSDNSQFTIEAAERLAYQNVRVFSIGIGPATNQEELLQIADNQKTHVFNTESFNELLDLLKSVSEIIYA